jgi:hypothetical protein
MDWRECARERYPEQIEVVREYLEQEAANSRIVEYAEIFHSIPSTDRFNIGDILGVISSDTFAQRGVMLSAIVVLQANGRPGKGFFSCAESLGLIFLDREEFWIEQVRRVFDAY